MADDPPQNREQRRAARYGRHRTDVRDAHDPWPTSAPNPALAEGAVEEGPDDDPTARTGPEAAGAEEPDGQQPHEADEASETKPKG
jgi:hypothetical protein